MERDIQRAAKQAGSMVPGLYEPEVIAEFRRVVTPEVVLALLARDADLTVERKAYAELRAQACRARNLIECGETTAALNCLCDAIEVGFDHTAATGSNVKCGA